MTCSECDWKGYLLGETSREARADHQAHLAVCESCREEWERLRLTQSLVGSLAEEEPPRRLAFVAETGETGWWRRFWQSGPRLGFASAAMLALAILVHGFTRPAAMVAPAPAPVWDRALLDAEIARRVDAALRASEERQAARLQAALEQTRRNWEFERRAGLLAMEENYTLLRKQMAQLARMSYVASAETAVRP